MKQRTLSKLIAVVCPPVVLGLLVGALACTTAEKSSRSPNSENASGERAYSVIAITDFHGALEMEKAVVGENQEIRFGGAEAVSTYVRMLRQKLGPNLLLDGGDLFQGTMLSNQFEGAPVIRFYKKLGVDAAALGNHEFDFGPVGDKAVPTQASDDAQGALKARMKEAMESDEPHFPILAANVVDETGRRPPWLRGSIVKEVNGIRVGVIGISDPQTPSTTNALNLAGLEFQPPAPAIIAEAKRLKTIAQVESIAVVAHMGAICGDNSPEKLTDLSSCTSTSIFEVVKALPRGVVDLVVAGHTHRTVMKQVNGTLILQAGSSGKNIGWGSVRINETGPNTVTYGGMASVCVTVMNTGQGVSCDTFALKDKKGTIEPAQFLGQPVVPDAGVSALFASELQLITDKKREPIGSVSLDREFERNYNKESTLGNLVADLQLEMHPNADIGMTNGGGLRANLPAGPLVYDHIFRLAPFDNQLALLTVTPAQLLKMMHTGAFGSHGAYIWSKNVSFTINVCDGKKSIEDVRINGQPIQLQADIVYRVSMSDYLAGGGSGIKELKLPAGAAEIFWDRKFLLREGMVDVLKKWNRALRAKDFYDPQSPRQKTAVCP